MPTRLIFKLVVLGAKLACWWLSKNQPELCHWIDRLGAVLLAIKEANGGGAAPPSEPPAPAEPTGGG